jgi:hypothetical protein
MYGVNYNVKFWCEWLFAVHSYVTLRGVIHSFQTIAVMYRTRQPAVLISSFILCLQCFSAEIPVKGKAVPLQAWSGSEASRKLRFPDFMTTAQDGGKDVSLTYRPPLPSGNTPGTHFC